MQLVTDLHKFSYKHRSSDASLWSKRNEMKPQVKTELTQELKLGKLGRRVPLGGNTCAFPEAEATCDTQKRNSRKHQAESNRRKQ